jgi:hypothetical protein
MNRTNRCYLSFSSRRTAVWGAHASRVLVKAFCLHELPNCFYKRALPRTLSTRHLYLSNE